VKNFTEPDIKPSNTGWDLFRGNWRICKKLQAGTAAN
jgi:hypothetical protein